MPHRSERKGLKEGRKAKKLAAQPGNGALKAVSVDKKHESSTPKKSKSAATSSKPDSTEPKRKRPWRRKVRVEGKKARLADMGADTGSLIRER